MIPMGTYLMDYRGEMLNQAEYDERYPDGADADYVVGIDGVDGCAEALYIDAASVSKSNLARYMNHAVTGGGQEPTCYALTLRDPPRLMLFALRDVLVGEELVWDYGTKYWAGRDDLLEHDESS